MASAGWDLVVIGAGSGGLECGWQANDTYKKRVAIIDLQKEHGVAPDYSALGGTCVNIGCVPKKLMVTGASYRDLIHDSKGFGWDVPTAKPSWSAMLKAKNDTVRNINKSYEEMFSESLIFVQGFARFAGPNKVEVLDKQQKVTQTLDAKNVVIATGSWPVVPPYEGQEHVITSNEAFYLPECPKNILIVGGGYIAVEFAGIFNGYLPPGGKVTLCYRGPLFLRGFDVTLREELAKQMAASGIELRFNCNPKKISKTTKGKEVLFEDGTVQVFDEVMVATGRRPRTDGLQCDKVGITLSPSGAVVCPKGDFATSAPNIFAIGDVLDKIQLTPVAIREGAALAGLIFGGKKELPDYQNVPSAVFSIPPIGTVGLLEEDAAKKFDLVNVYINSFLPLMHQLTGSSHRRVVMKLVTRGDTDQVVGVHLLGAEAAECIQGIAVAVRCGVTLRHFYETVGVHPTSAEELCCMKTPEYFYKRGVKTTPEKKS